MFRKGCTSFSFVSHAELEESTATKSPKYHHSLLFFLFRYAFYRLFFIYLFPPAPLLGKLIFWSNSMSFIVQYLFDQWKCKIPLNPHVRRFVGWSFLSQFQKRLASYTSRLLSEHYSLLTALPSIGLLVYCKHFRIASINGEYLMQAMQYLDSAIYKQGWNDSEPNQASRLLVKKIN